MIRMVESRETEIRRANATANAIDRIAAAYVKYGKTKDAEVARRHAEQLRAKAAELVKVTM